MDDAQYLQQLGEAFGRHLRPPERMSLPDWCDAHMQLPAEGTAEHGQYRTSRTPYVAEIARCLDADSGCNEVVWMAASQVGKSQLLNNYICHTIEADPANIILLQPTKELAETYSTMRIDPLIRANPLVQAAIRDHGKSRAGGDRTLLKSFAGGFLRFVGANAPGDLASMPIPRVCVDELDRCSASSGREGDPVELLRKRMSTFGERQMLIVSSPGAKPSKIAERYADGDQCQYWVPCPHCEQMQVLRWGTKEEPGVVWPTGRPELAQYQCCHCGALIDEGHKTQMLARGQWRPQALPKVPGLRSFHLSALYSPVGWYSWADAAQEFVRAGKDPAKLQVFVNTVLAEEWDDALTHEVTGDAIYDARERWPAEVPAGVQVLTAACDVQGDRLEYQVMGWGAGEESWIISHVRLDGDPSLPHVWGLLDDQIARVYTTSDGKALSAKVILVDSGDGSMTAQVYGYCSRRRARSVFAIKGRSGNHPTWPTRATYTAKGQVYVVGVDTGKAAIYPRIKRIGSGAGPGMIHLPEADWADLEYCEQLASEIPHQRRLKTGTVIREWRKVRERNEAFDLTNYCLIGLHYLVSRGLRMGGGATPRPAARTEPAVPRPVAPEPVSVHPARVAPRVKPRTIGVY